MFSRAVNKLKVLNKSYGLRSMKRARVTHRDVFARSLSESKKNTATESVKVEACGPDIDDEEEDEMEEMFVQGPAGMEWGGPTRGGRRPEPTRFGDWERKGRVSDF